MTSSTTPASASLSVAARAAARFAADPRAFETALSGVRFHTPPICQGQIVEVSYGSDCDGLVYRRVHDRSDRSTVYQVADREDCGCSFECGCFEPWNSEPSGFAWVRVGPAAPPTTWAAYYAVCDCNGPISVWLDADTEEEAIAAFAALDARAAIDYACTDLEDDLDIDGTDMDEETFAAACEARGARPVRGLEGDGTISGAWHLWVLPAEEDSHSSRVG